jgi:hypothetical protein
MRARKASPTPGEVRLSIAWTTPVECAYEIRIAKAKDREAAEPGRSKELSWFTIDEERRRQVELPIANRQWPMLRHGDFGFRRSLGLRASALGIRLPRGERNRLFPLLALLCVFCTAALGQWTNQTITLRPGWNAVFLEVQPAPADCDTLFASIPVESVWAWNRRFSSVQYIQDPNTLVPGQPNWLCYVPPSSTNHTVNNLYVLQGDRAYLIKLASNATPVAWTVRGRASVRGIDWLSDSLNLVGFHISSNSPPTFQSFFAASPAHVGQAINRLNAAGAWVRVINPSTDRLNSGEAYWVQCLAQSSYAGPISISFEQGRGVDYARILTEQTLTIKNNTSGARTVIIAQLLSGAPPSSSYPALAGEVPLSYWRTVFPTNFGFIPLPARLTNTISAGGQWAIRLAVRRPDMKPFTLPPGYTDARYQSLLEVTDTGGSRWVVPVTAEGLQSYNQASLRLRSNAYANGVSPTPNPRAGLWVGSAVVNQVNQPANLTNGVALFPTATEFQLRLLLHVDDGGQVRMLRKVLQMWKDGTYQTNNNGILEVDQPGRYVLVTDDNLIPSFSGSALRDGQRVARRFSTTAFSFPTPLTLAGTGDFGASNGVFSCTDTIDYDSPLNPFKHQYHPDHDNLDERFAEKLPEGVESFSIARQIQFQFTATDPDGLTLAGWGDNQVGGIYRETIRGLHNSALYVQGTFRLRQTSRVGVLNDGL